MSMAERQRPDFEPPAGLMPMTNAAAATAASFAHQHMEQFLNSKVQAERLLLGMARLQDALRDLEVRGLGVFAKVPLHQGTRFGPYPISELCADKSDGSWDVSVYYFS